MSNKKTDGYTGSSEKLGKGKAVVTPVAEAVIEPGLPKGYFLRSQLRKIIKNIPRLRRMR
jgi:hypothetical protein